MVEAAICVFMDFYSFHCVEETKQPWQQRR